MYDWTPTELAAAKKAARRMLEVEAERSGEASQRKGVEPVNTPAAIIAAACPGTGKDAELRRSFLDRVAMDFAIELRGGKPASPSDIRAARRAGKEVRMATTKGRRNDMKLHRSDPWKRKERAA